MLNYSDRTRKLEQMNLDFILLPKTLHSLAYIRHTRQTDKRQGLNSKGY